MRIVKFSVSDQGTRWPRVHGRVIRRHRNGDVTAIFVASWRRQPVRRVKRIPQRDIIE